MLNTLDKQDITTKIINIEKIILSKLIQDPDSIVIILDILKRDHFTLKDHKNIFDTIKYFYLKSELFNYCELKLYFETNISKENNESLIVLNSLPLDSYTTNNIKYYAFNLIEHTCLNEFVTGISLIEKEIATSELDNYEFFIRIKELIYKIEKKYYLKNCKQLMYEFHDTINELEIREKSQKSIYIPTGFDKLDKLIKGIKPQDLIVIAGNPGTGNTAFLMSLIVNIINHSSTQIVYFSFDLTVQNLFIRLISTLTKINLTKLEDGLISENECDVIYNTLNPLPDNQLYFYEQTNYNYSELKFQIEKLIFQYNIKIVAIDYLQIISNGEVMTQESYMLITKELKLIAKELKISIILVSHINHIPVNEISKISDLQEISYLFEYSNVFLMLNQLNFNLNMFDDTDSNSTDYELIVAKNTNSKKGKVQMQMNNSYLQFTELDT